MRDLQIVPEKFNDKQYTEEFNTNFDMSINNTKEVTAVVDTVKSIEKTILPSHPPCSKNTTQNEKKCKKSTSNIDAMENILDRDSNKHKSGVLKKDEEPAGTKNMNTKINLRKNETVVSEDYSKNRERNNNFDDTKETEYLKKKNYDNPAKVSVPGQSRECTEVADDKIKEIANYLSQYFLPVKENKLERFVTKPKISIQGVEKPGGILKMHKSRCVKTYQNKKNNFKNRKYAGSNNLIKKINVENHEINDKVNDPSAHSIVEQICVCKDFGKLKFYDNKCDYQHIHFWNRNIAQCSIVTLLEIYKTDSMKVSKENDAEIENHQHINSHFNQYDPLQNICYTTYLSYKNGIENDINNVKDKLETDLMNLKDLRSIDFNDVSSIDVDENTIEMNNVTTKCSVQINEEKSTTTNLSEEVDVNAINNATSCRKNRKRPVEPFHEEHNDDCATVSKYKKNKQSIKCAVCTNEVSEDNWEEHLSNEHCYIAWKVGHCIDLNDGKLLSNIHRRLQEVGLLKCTFCGKEYKHLKKFMKHIKVCLETAKSDPNLREELKEKETDSNTVVKCGVCSKEMCTSSWLDHIATEHNYQAWRSDEPALDVNDKHQIEQHLEIILKETGELACARCGLVCKQAKFYMQHNKTCDGNKVDRELAENSANDQINNISNSFEVDNASLYQVMYKGVVKCGVCHEIVSGEEWLDHIHKEHNYLARVEGVAPLDVNDEEAVHDHLKQIRRITKILTCAKCGLQRKFINKYLQHIKSCNGIPDQGSDTNTLDQTKDSHEIDKANNSVQNNTVNKSIDMSEFVYTGIAKCGVCQEKVEGVDWIDHIQKRHNYLAWIDGETPLDLENTEKVYMHLYSLLKFTNGLICKFCGIKRKYVKTFMAHIDNCSTNMSLEMIDEDKLVECAICLEKVNSQNWKSHAMNDHYNIAWTTDMKPINVRNVYEVERFLKEYKEVNKKLVCKVCNIYRASYVGFYAHITTCGKTEEEIDFYKTYCDICKSKYLCIYKHQHLASHREQEFMKEKKIRLMEESFSELNTELQSTKRHRKAAQRANLVIQNFKTCDNSCKHKCSSCRFGTDLESELESHKCETHSDFASDSDASIQFDGQSEEDSDSDVDSDISMEEGANKKKRCNDLSPKVHQIVSKVNNASQYVSQGAMDFIKTHYSLDVLFPQWTTNEYEELDSKDSLKYLPILDESCKVKIGNEGWTTYKRFEAKENEVISLFAGGSVRCVSWVPLRAESNGTEKDKSCGNYLAVATHMGADTPHLPASQTVAHRSLVQLWCFEDFTRLPKFVLGIAHDYGTLWAMDWCPSGVRDKDNQISGEARLGLLAIACSNGSAYIFAVPYPNPKNLDNPQIIKIKPSAELRLCSGGERDKYQATAICWSQQKGHSVILVGYADGTTAFYNFDCDSPLLKTVVDGVSILYPFQEDRPHNTCISDVGLFPSYGEDGSECGAWSGASSTGAHAALRAAAPRLHVPLATARATFAPHWPSVIVTADEATSKYTKNELEWHGGGRRLGGQRALTLCMRCGVGVAYVPPALRVTRLHPAYRDQRRDVVGLIQMTPLAKKRSKHVNDDLSMKVEPLIYENAIKEYGLQFKHKIHMNKGDNIRTFCESKQYFPERFPLADVTSMSFCPSPSSHEKLAVATHAGIIFIVNI